MEYISKNQLSLLLPVIINKIMNLSPKDNRPAFFKSSLLDNIGALLSPCDYIIDNIYLGSSTAASDIELLRSLNIKYVCNISDNIPNFFENKIKYFNISKKDNGKDNINKYELEESFKFIKKSKEKNCNILVHCFVGRSRSVSVLIYYLMKEYDFSIKESIYFLKKKRKWINPSIKFIENIINIVNEING